MSDIDLTNIILSGGSCKHGICEGRMWRDCEPCIAEANALGCYPVDMEDDWDKFKEALAEVFNIEQGENGESDK